MAGGLTLNGSDVSRMQTRRQGSNSEPPFLSLGDVYKCEITNVNCNGSKH